MGHEGPLDSSVASANGTHLGNDSNKNEGKSRAAPATRLQAANQSCAQALHKSRGGHEVHFFRRDAAILHVRREALEHPRLSCAR